MAAEVPVAADGSLVGVNGDDWFVDAALAAPADAEAAAWESELDAERTPAIGTVAVLAEVTEPEEADAATEEALSAESDFPAAELALIGGGVAGLGVLTIASSDETETAPGEAAVLDDLDEADDWLSAEWPEDAGAPVLQADELDELPDVEIVEETVIAPATNAPDWLNAMVPGLDVDYVPGDETAFDEQSAALDTTLGARSEYAWVIDWLTRKSTRPRPPKWQSRQRLRKNLASSSATCPPGTAGKAPMAVRTTSRTGRAMTCSCPPISNQPPRSRQKKAMVG